METIVLVSTENCHGACGQPHLWPSLSFGHIWGRLITTLNRPSNCLLVDLQRSSTKHANTQKPTRKAKRLQRDSPLSPPCLGSDPNLSSLLQNQILLVIWVGQLQRDQALQSRSAEPGLAHRRVHLSDKFLKFVLVHVL